MIATAPARSNGYCIQSDGWREVPVFALGEAIAAAGPPQWPFSNGDDILKASAIRQLVVRLGKLVGNRQLPDGRGAWSFVLGDDGAVYGVFWSPHRRLGIAVPPHPVTKKLLGTSGKYSQYGWNLQQELKKAAAQFDEQHQLQRELSSESPIDEFGLLRQDLNDIRVQTAAHLDGFKLPSEKKEDDYAAYRDTVTVNDIEIFVPALETGGSSSRQVDDSLPPATDLSDVVEQLLADYAPNEQRLTSFSGPCPLPNRAKVVKITKAFFPILFPGYHGPRPNAKHFRTFLERRIAWLRKHLAIQINRALHFQHQSDPTDDTNSQWGDEDYTEWAEEKTEALLTALPRIRRLLEQDVKAALNADPAVWDHHEIVAAYPGIYATAVYRLAHELDESSVPLIPRIMTEHSHSITGIDIHPSARIAAGFFVDHGTGVVVGATSEIGRNVTLYQGVTLGAISFPRDENGQLIRGEKRHPTLEPEVVVYANASVLGGQTVVGRNSVIGANVQLSHSVPPEKIASIQEYALRFRDRTKPVARKGQEYSI